MIDLDAIEARAEAVAAGFRYGNPTSGGISQAQYLADRDVPALTAEVHRLRRMLASLICLPCRGEGRINNGETCSTCGGTGTYEQLGYVRE